MRPFDRHVKQPITFHFVLRYVSGLENVDTITDRCVKLSDVFKKLYAVNLLLYNIFNISHNFENPAFS